MSRLSLDGRKLTSNFLATVREISHCPFERLKVQEHDTPSLIDEVKSFVERNTGERWHWWPLAPRVHALADGYNRLTWPSVSTHC